MTATSCFCTSFTDTYARSPTLSFVSDLIARVVLENVLKNINKHTLFQRCRVCPCSRSNNRPPSSNPSTQIISWPVSGDELTQDVKPPHGIGTGQKKRSDWMKLNQLLLLVSSECGTTAWPSHIFVVPVCSTYFNLTRLTGLWWTGRGVWSDPYVCLSLMFSTITSCAPCEQK